MRGPGSESFKRVPADGRREVLVDDYDQLKGAKMDVLRVLPGVGHSACMR